MAQTTLMPLDPAMSPQHVARVLTISADLLPDEITAARRARSTRAWVLAVVGVVVLGLLGWFLVADNDTQHANDDLDQVTAQQARLQRKQAEYAKVVNTQSENTTITKELTTLMANDLQWAALIDAIRDTGDDTDAKVQGIAAALQEAAPSGGTALPTTSGAATIGAITVTGSAPDKPSVAQFTEQLNKVNALANAYVTTVTQKDDKTVDFTLTVDITSRAQCGRFTTKCKTTGGN